MESVDWHDSEQAVAAVAELVASPFERANEELSRLLGTLVPHDAMAVLTGSCARSPMAVVGDPAVTERITSADLARMAGSVAVGEPWMGTTQVGGVDRPVLAAAAGPVDHGALLLLVRPADAPIACGDALLVQHIWSVVAGSIGHHAEQAEPGDLTASRAAASECARVTSQLVDVHAATLAGLLGTLRNRDLDDAAAHSATCRPGCDALGGSSDDAGYDEVDGDHVDDAFWNARELLEQPSCVAEDDRFGHAEPADPTGPGLGDLPAPVAQARRANGGLRGAVAA